MHGRRDDQRQSGTPTVGDLLTAYDAIKAEGSAMSHDDGPAFQLAKDFFAKEPPPIRWTIQGLIEDKTFGIIGGEPKTSKSWFALEAALSVASGIPMLGQFPTNGERRPVALIMLEDSPHNVYARLRALAASKGISVDELAGLPIYLRFKRGIDLATRFDTRWVIDAVNGANKDMALVLIDPLRNAHTAEENDSKSMTSVCDNIRDIRDATGSAIVLTHHLRKPSASDESSPGHALRGSGALYGAIDGLVVLMNKRRPEDSNIWRNNIHVRVKAGREAIPFQAVLKVHDGPDGRACKAEWAVSAIPDEDRSKKR